MVGWHQRLDGFELRSMSLSKLQVMEKPGVPQSMGLQRVGKTEQ